MRLSDLLSLKRKAAAAEPPADDGNLGVYRGIGSKPVVMVTVLGIQPELIDEIVTVMRRKFQPAHRLVFLTDSTDFGVFRRHGLVFEYLPSTLEQRVHADTMSWPSYLSERWALLVAKWRPLHIIAYGRNIDAFIAAAPSSVARPS